MPRMGWVLIGSWAIANRKLIHARTFDPTQVAVAGSRSHAGEELMRFLDHMGPHMLISMGSSLKNMPGSRRTGRCLSALRPDFRMGSRSSAMHTAKKRAVNWSTCRGNLFSTTQRILIESALLCYRCGQPRLGAIFMTNRFNNIGYFHVFFCIYYDISCCCQCGFMPCTAIFWQAGKCC